MDEIRLEYNERQGCFHFEDISKNNENTNGWVTICNCISCDDALKFTEMIDKKYKNESKSVKIIINEFKNR